jgi:hypothetical protein
VAFLGLIDLRSFFLLRHFFQCRFGKTAMPMTKVTQFLQSNMHLAILERVFRRTELCRAGNSCPILIPS